MLLAPTPWGHGTARLPAEGLANEETHMNEPGLQTFRHLRQRPLAMCLAATLGIGLAVNASAASSALSPPARVAAHPLQPRITGLDSLPVGSRLRDAWETALANAPPPHPASTIPVTNCSDSDAGSLRLAMLLAADGDTIDMSNLTCSTITLTTGAATTSANNLTLKGRARGALRTEITANGSSSVLYHFGTGTLQLTGLDITDGMYSGYYPAGGCIRSLGNVALANVVVNGCSASSPAGSHSESMGGAIYALGSVRLTNSTVTHGYVASPDYLAYGGGIFALGKVTSNKSQVSYNSASSDSGIAAGGGVFASGGFNSLSSTISYNVVSSHYAWDARYGGIPSGACGGGVRSDHGAVIKYSAITGNTAQCSGGIELNYAPDATGWIADSTISGNSASYNNGGPPFGAYNGGVLSSIPLTIRNSTIAFNTEDRYQYCLFTCYPSDFAAGVSLWHAPVTLQSNIIANNTYTYQDQESDLGGYGVASVNGARNLIGQSDIPVPPLTLLNTDPLLLPLAYNGGPTRTHALDPMSPAIDFGRNPSGLRYDQRGAGHPRVVGANADLGAFEWSP